jgi:hypothetical protein
MTEGSSLQSLLINLLYHLNQGKTGDPWYTAVRALGIENGPLDQYKQTFIQLMSKVERQDGLQMVKRRLLWKFGNEEVGYLSKAAAAEESREHSARDGSFVGLTKKSRSHNPNFGSKLTQAIRDNTLSVRDGHPIYNRALSPSSGC